MQSFQEFRNVAQQWCNSSCTIFGELSGVWHIVPPKRSRWLVKPELLLDHCGRLTRTVRRRWRASSLREYSWGEEEACCGEKTASASLEYSYRRGFVRMTCRLYDYSWDCSNLMVKKEPFFFFCPLRWSAPRIMRASFISVQWASCHFCCLIKPDAYPCF